MVACIAIAMFVALFGSARQIFRLETTRTGRFSSRWRLSFILGIIGGYKAKN